MKIPETCNSKASRFIVD